MTDFLDSNDFTVESLFDDILGVLKRRKLFVAIVGVCISLLVYGVLLYLNDKYEVNATLIVKLGKESVAVPLGAEKGSVYRQGVTKEDINTYISLLQSAPTLEQALALVGEERFEYKPEKPENLLQSMKAMAKRCARFGKSLVNDALIMVKLRKRLTDHDKLLLSLSRSITVMHEKDANTILIHMKTIDPILGRDYLDALIECYLDAHGELMQGNDMALQALEEQTTANSERLKSLRGELASFKQENAIDSIHEQRTALIAIKSELKESVYKSKREISGYESARDYMVDRQGTVDDLVLSNVIESLGASRMKAQEKIAQLSVKRAEMAVRLKDTAPQLKVIDEEIGALEALLVAITEETIEEEVYIRNPLVNQMESRRETMGIEIHALRSQVDVAELQLKQVDSELRQLDVAEGELRRLELEIAVAEKRFLNHADLQVGAEFSELLRRSDVDNVSVLVAPYYNAKPVFPRRLIFMLIGVLGGFGIGFGLALFFEWTNGRLYDTRLLEKRPGVLVLGEYRVNHDAVERAGS